MVALYTNTRELLRLKEHNREGDKVNMCQAITEMLQDERAEGLNQGIEVFILDNIEENIPMERICEKLQRRFGLTVTEAEEVYRKYS